LVSCAGFYAVGAVKADVHRLGGQGWAQACIEQHEYQNWEFKKSSKETLFGIQWVTLISKLN
jgi:hypothetical protein